MNTKECFICGKSFMAHNKTKETCSPACQLVNHRNKMKAIMRTKRAEEKVIITKTCVICRQPFNTYKVDNVSTCLGCKIARASQPVKQYDHNNVDSDGIINGVITPKNYDL